MNATGETLARREAILHVMAALEAVHAWRGWHWWPDADPFEVAVGAILVQNTAWTNVEHALAALRAADALAPERMAGLPADALESLVRPSGQYRQKARKLQAFLATAAAAGGFGALMALEPQVLRPRLLGTWGIGPETADAILAYAAAHPALVIDAYTKRLFGRLGLGPAGRDYATWQQWFLEALPPDEDGARDRFARLHALIVLHARHLCRKQRPLCGDCTLAVICPAAGTVPPA